MDLNGIDRIPNVSPSLSPLSTSESGAPSVAREGDLVPSGVTGARVVATQRYRISTLTIREPLLVLVLRGLKTVHAPAGSQEVRAGQVLLLNRQTCWDVVNDPHGQTQYEALALAFPEALIASLQRNHLVLGRRVVHESQVLGSDAHLQEAILRTVPRTAGSMVSSVVMQHRAMEVLLQLNDLGYRFNSARNLSWSDRISHLVAQRPDEDWNVQRLAGVFHVSESTLRRRMADTQTTLAVLVKQVRLEVALGLLQTTDLAIGAVAHRCGWASHSRFSAAFLQRWGVTPSVVAGRRTDAGQNLTDSG